MWAANFAGAILFCKVPDPDHGACFSIGSLKDQVEKFFLSIFQVTPYGVGAQVGNLNHAGKLAIHK